MFSGDPTDVAYTYVVRQFGILYRRISTSSTCTTQFDDRQKHIYFVQVLTLILLKCGFINRFYLPILHLQTRLGAYNKVMGICYIALYFE